MARQLALWILLLALCSTASAGSICGVVRNASTLAPVPQAGVFVYQNGVYADFYGATDLAGAYCIAGIPDGIYDLAVRVDDYQIAWVGGVVLDTTTNVDIPASALIGLDAPWPNPSSDGVFLRYRLARASAMRLEIFDLKGRRVRGWDGTARPGDDALFWDFRDRSGQPVASGSYLVRMTVDGQTRTRTLQRVQ